MKRFILLMLMICATTYTQSQMRNFSHWSFTLEGGVNKFDGDINQVYNDIIPNSYSKLSLGASIEYTITPVWSLGLDYYHLPYGATGNYYTLRGKANDATLFTSFNVIKMFIPTYKSKFNVWATLGAGISAYSVDYQTDNDGLKNSEGNTDNNANFGDGNALTIPVGTLIEYNISKSLAIGAKLQYRAYNKDNLDGRVYWGVTNDYLSLGTLQLRWKFNAIDKDHTRNISMVDFNKSPEDAKSTAALKKLQNQLDSLQNKYDKILPELENADDLLKAGLDSDNDAVPDIRDKEPNTPIGHEVDFYGRSIDNQNKPFDNPTSNLSDIDYFTNNGPDEDMDGVPDNRDKELNTTKDKPVDFWGREIKGSDTNGFGSVYFDFDMTDLDNDAEATIKLVSELLNADPLLLVEVRGFADYMGTDNYNLKLSQRRADKVKSRLVNVYGISPNRIISNGKGRIYEPQTAYRLNRRCNFYLSK